MIELENFNCKIFTDYVEPGAMETIYEVCRNKAFEGKQVRVMPDVHSGEGIVIGFTAPLGDWVNPDHVGCDLGCSISALFMSEPIPADKYPLFEHRLKKTFPLGKRLQEQRMFEVKDFLKFLRESLRKAYQKTGGLTIVPEFQDEDDLEEWMKDVGIDPATFYKSIGTIGGGNHFIEYGTGVSPSTAIFGGVGGDMMTPIQAVTIHTGSRNLGQRVWRKWHDIANKVKLDKQVERQITREVRERTKDKTKIREEIDKAIAEYKSQGNPGYLEGEDLRYYLTDMVIAQAYAAYNHQTILRLTEEIYQGIVKEAKKVGVVTTTHNYIDFDTVDGIPMIRKGAVRANLHETFLLPFNMRDGMAVCVGKGNPDWNYSCSHGAGRVMSRAKAKDTLKLKDFEKSMEGIYSTSVNISTIDESPMAYKPMEEIIENIKPTADILYFIKPAINIKAGAEDEVPNWRALKKKK